ncbi:ABC transporter permease [Nocardioides sp. CER19]|uniref:ABC transporter permease n=1 Tax=Nocardioides sp. CER19 TaxID=3038538 RepID=UPI00244ACF99|nr:ABC transporter permease [Nocardioides sp. CER19]MDH2416050.1 ABC transporter permease [Nocardioides sp. CER19]
MTATIETFAGRRPHVQPRRVGTGAVLRWELRKLAHQWRAKAVLLAALVGPIPVVFVIHGQSRPPKDSLFGRFATENGFALALLILGFAAQWALPLLTSIVAGDIFASEDQHGTWKTVLTRSTSRGRIFWAKTLTAALFAVVTLAVLAASTIASSVLIVGRQPLTGLSGQQIAPSHALALVTASWASMLPGMLAFTCLAILISVWSRNPAAGIAAPAVIGMVMQLVGALGGVEPIRPFLLSTGFEAWHGLLTAPRFTQPILEGAVTSAGWCVVTLAIAYLTLRRRDITGG